MEKSLLIATCPDCGEQTPVSGIGRSAEEHRCSAPPDFVQDVQEPN